MGGWEGFGGVRMWRVSEWMSRQYVERTELVAFPTHLHTPLGNMPIIAIIYVHRRQKVCSMLMATQTAQTSTTHFSAHINLDVI